MTVHKQGKLLKSVSLCSGLFLLCVSFNLYAATKSISLQQAEYAALQQTPDIKESEAKAHALKEAAVASGQLQDPKLEFSAQNFPTDTFRLDQEAMTQLQLGISQAFPRGKTLKYTELQNEKLAAAEQTQSHVISEQVLRSVRLAWLELYYWQASNHLIRQQQQVFQHLYEVTKALLASNKAQQNDVIQAQLELDDLQNRLINTEQQLDTARANLARWIGKAMASRALPSALPHWKRPPPYRTLQANLKHHPEINTTQNLIAANQANVMVAKQQYKPGIALGLKYGYRQGKNFDRSTRSDLMTANVSVDLPFFTKNRQDKTLSASESRLVASEEGRQATYRQLKETLAAQYAAWRSLSSRALLYQKTLIPESKAYAESTLITYQNNKTDFQNLADSYIRELETQLSGLKVATDQAKARVNLLYLQGL